MKLTVKTLKGVKFEVQVEDSNAVSEVKTIIEKEKPELPAAGMKLIHSGKVLKDADVISTCGIKPNDFLVVMVTKAKKAAAAPPAPVAAAAAAAAAAPASEAAAAASEAPPSASATAAAAFATTATAATTTTSTGSTEAAPGRADDLPAEAIANLTSMGFPEAEVRHCLRAADGNPDVAVEFLTNGIPEAVAATMNRADHNGGGSGSGTTTTRRGAGSEQLLQALRDHPQFNDLRRLVQSNPQMLQQVLTQIGQQQPELLQEINANQALFLQMMNEPVEAAPSSSSAPAASSGNAGGAMAGLGGPAAGLGNPSQMAQMIQNMSAEEVNQMAAMMGISPDHLRQTAQVIGQMPPEQINQFMMQAMGGGGGADQQGLAGLMGGIGGRQLIVELTEEEMQAVDRLAEMGFDRAEAAQAFLACDKNEALAANLLMDSMGDGGGFYGGGGDNNNDGGGDGGNGNNDDDDDMYD